MSDNNPTPIELQKYLGGVDYPANREQLVDTARRNGAPEELVSALENSDTDSFDSPTDVSEAVAGS